MLRQWTPGMISALLPLVTGVVSLGLSFRPPRATDNALVAERNRRVQRMLGFTLTILGIWQLWQAAQSSSLAR